MRPVLSRCEPREPVHAYRPEIAPMNDKSIAEVKIMGLQEEVYQTLFQDEAIGTHTQ
jgi:hypothetical protein